MYERTYTKKVLQQTTPVEKKKKRRFPLKRFLIGVGIFVFVGGIIWIIRLPALHVKTIEIEGTTVTDPEEVREFVFSRIEGNSLYIFPRKSMLLVPTTFIEKSIKKQFPRFSDVTVRRKGIAGLELSVAEHEGALLWCESDDRCFFMTKEGVVFAEAPFFSGDAYERVFFGAVQELPFYPLPEQMLTLIHTLQERLPSIGIIPLSYKGVSERQFDISFSHNNATAQLMIDPSASIDETLEDLATGLATEPLKSAFSSEKKTLEYLDARFANKVVYKFK